ncbi:MAG TPA: N-acetyl-gamma-glutamyl-phosphate reductase [SAR86 cluster bacterium]|jgi:N-acetyl-gamma-glutamyl-phosphate reductase|nr:N-acetyl-gamma-glutamyl-phosphate reductase [SAR86 cluster bacterium]HJM14918.1 N-acetyl-gamma-glutamyl-phosphate reductase [SAR86 cluster bacterium]HJM59622.1 N-acetyl-gamma-glutamyl-phosphate reductase [SAR86 cluster bacterium]
MNNILTKVGILGGSGFTGEELLRILSNHPRTEVVAVSSRELLGQSTNKIVEGSELVFVEPNNDIFYECEIIFFATPHGVSMDIVGSYIERNIKVIDLSADFRLKDKNIWEEWYDSKHTQAELLSESVYGLTELNLEEIKSARLVAVPGCYPTASLLGVLPLLNSELQIESIIIDAKSGISGAGRKAVENSLSKEIKENFRAYGLEGHRHLPEIREVAELLSGYPIKLNFVPHLIPTMRGIYSTIYLQLKEFKGLEILGLYNSFYKDSPNVRIMRPGEVPDIKSIANTNNCHISVNHSNIENQVIVISSIDNLVKGAAGQAVECYNLMNGFGQRTGLDNG